MDLASIVPYYTGHLCAAFREPSSAMRIDAGFVTYHHDRGFFERLGLRARPGVLDLAARLPRLPEPARKAVKLVEYAVNLAWLTMRFRLRCPDVVHVQFLPLAASALPLDRWAVAWWKQMGSQIVYTVHNVLPHDSGERYRAAFARIYSLADRLICHDTAARERLIEEFDIDARRISILPHGPLPLFPEMERAAARRKLCLPLDVPVVLCQGILRPYKGTAVLLEAWERVAAASQAMLLIAGSGEAELLESLTRQIAARKITGSVRTDFRFLSIEDLAAYYGAADIVVYPYTAVTGSGALMTGVCSGKAIVGSRLAGFETVLRDGENAALAEPGNADDLAARLSELVGSPELRERYARALRNSERSGPQWAEIARETELNYRAVVRGGETTELGDREVACES